MDIQQLDEEYEKRMVAFEVDCDQGRGDQWACHSVGEFLSVVKEDHKKAAQVYSENCKKHNFAPSCFNLGRLFLGGRGVVQDDATALTNFEKACEKGHTGGCYHAGLLLLYGKEGGYDVKQDVKKADKLLQQACDDSITESCYALGSHLIKRTKGVKRDPVRAKSVFEFGCARGHGRCCYNLAVMYKKGDDGVPSNQEEYEKFKKITEDVMKQSGGLRGTKGY